MAAVNASEAFSSPTQNTEFNIPVELEFPSSPTRRKRQANLFDELDPTSGYPSPLGGGGGTPKLRLDAEVTMSDGAFVSNFKNEGSLGEGGFGTVWKAVDPKTGVCYAMKTIPLTDIASKERFDMELSIHKKLQHPNICILHEATQDSTHYHLRMDLITGGSLADHLQMIRRMSRKVQGVTLSECPRYFWQMLSGITYLHHYRMAHRDIKPENYMVADDRQVRLIDFGLSRHFNKGEKMTTHGIGSLHYMAPEVLLDSAGGYDERCDLWSIGVTVFTIVLGEPPFNGAGDEELAKQIAGEEVNWDDPLFPVWKKDQAKEMKMVLERLLVRDLAKRPGAKTVVKESEWLRKNGAATAGCCCVAF